MYDLNCFEKDFSFESFFSGSSAVLLLSSPTEEEFEMFESSLYWRIIIGSTLTSSSVISVSVVSGSLGGVIRGFSGLSWRWE